MGNSPNVGGRAPIHLFASPKAWIEGEATRQLNIVAAMPGVEAVAAMPDLHPGKFGPVGCAILSDCIHPQLVGSDIGCGMALYGLDIDARKVRSDRLADRLLELEKPGKDVEEVIADSGLPVSPFDASLGSIGGGNHFCEVQAIEDIIAPDVAARHGLARGQAFVLVHSGSRGLGYAILERTLRPGNDPLAPQSETGRAYLAAHDHAVRWARLNRSCIAKRAAEAARADCRLIADLAHNMLEIVPAAGLTPCHPRARTSCLVRSSARVRYWCPSSGVWSSGQKGTPSSSRRACELWWRRGLLRANVAPMRSNSRSIS
jgi:release factor H-coupled RctB family protein